METGYLPAEGATDAPRELVACNGAAQRRPSRKGKWSPDDPRRKKNLKHRHQQQQEKLYGHQAPHLVHHQPKHPTAERMGRGELYEYYKRQGLLEVYFRMFPNG